MKKSFDLEQSIATWKAFLESNSTFLPDDIEELERHVRDQVRELVGRGMDPREAFDRAVGQIGALNDVDDAYRRVYWRKALSPSNLTRSIASTASLLASEFKVAWRRSLRNGLTTAINAFGLSIGIAACLLIGIFLKREYSYDRHHSRADDIFRLTLLRDTGDESERTVNTPLFLSERLAETLPNVEHSSVFGPFWDGVVSASGRQFHESSVFIAEDPIFDIFDFEFIHGSREQAFGDPNGIVLTQSAAERYFGDENPVGETLTFTFEGSFDFHVSAVIEDIPSASHFSFEFLISARAPAAFYDMFVSDREWDFRPTYLVKSPLATAEDVQRSIASLSHALFEGAADMPELGLQRLADVHLNSVLDGEFGQGGSRRLNAFLAVLALIILCIAGINFVNLTTAKSLSRVREVGVRKAMGARRISLVRQHQTESVVVGLSAAAIAVFVAVATFPIFKSIVQVELELTAIHLLILSGLGLLFGTISGLLAGLFPAFSFASGKGARAMKAGSGRGEVLRKTLVVVQFAATIFFLSVIALMTRQLKHLDSLDLGYEPDQLLTLRSPQRTTPTPYEEFKQVLGRVDGVIAVAGAGDLPGGPSAPNEFDVAWRGASAEDRTSTPIFFVHPDFFDVYDLEFVEGFVPDPLPDSSAVMVLNESAATLFASSGELQGMEMEAYFGTRADPVFSHPVAGVVENFTFESFKSSVGPAILRVAPRAHTWTYLAARVNLTANPSLLSDLSDAWRTVAPEWPMEARFVDEQIAGFHEADARSSRIFGIFAMLAAMLACLGLFGLSVHAAQSRVKEIAVRKVLGASAPKIVVLLSKNYLLLVVLSAIVAVPTAWYAMTAWLEQFAYRTAISPLYFGFALMVTLVLAALTMLAQSVRASLRQPAESLRMD